jgi:hypothetical protein
MITTDDLTDILSNPALVQNLRGKLKHWCWYNFRPY